MELPKEWNVDNIRVDYDFLSEVALIQAPDFKLRRGAVAPQFRNVLLYNKAKNTPLAELTVPKDQYFGMVTLAPEGKLVYALVKSMADDGARTFKIWSIEDGKWLEDINLTRESVTEPASKGKSKG